MKKLILTLAIGLTAIASWAQKPVQESSENNGKFQISAFGGYSMPQGKYKNDIGRAKDGYFGGVALDQYFNGNHWGLGVDARFLNHDIRKMDSVFFTNGFLATAYANKAGFEHIAVSAGPTYKANFGKIDLEAFARGGVLFQKFPEYTQSLFVNAPAGPPVSAFDTYYTSNPKNKAKAWMGLGGIRLTYAFNSNWGVFLQGDYLRTFGKSFGKDSSEFHITRYGIKKQLTTADVIIVKDGRITNLNEFYEEKSISEKTYVQSVNIAAGIRFTFGAKPKAAKPVETAAPVKIEPKDILVVVKDKQTGLALSGVTVKISRNGVDNVSISNANGEAERVKAAERGSYQITAVKNGISAMPVTVTDIDFDRAGTVIYKEIYHDDPRFTLIGETLNANDNTKLPGINTVLTNTATDKNMSQISDGEAKFVYQLDQQSDYSVVANQSGKFSQTEGLSTVGLDRSKTLYVTLKLGISNLNAGASFVLKNIHYDFDKADIRPDAARILNNVYNVLMQNPTLKIELSSHTDSRGKDAYNMDLSQRRAESAVNYLVGKGISRERLEARGYGESRLLNACANGVTCSEEAHQANRRTEIKVLNY
jgi:outer membrane protein OmpA-like peptidoglycan-associated protein